MGRAMYTRIINIVIYITILVLSGFNRRARFDLVKKVDLIIHIFLSISYFYSPNYIIKTMANIYSNLI